PGTPVATGGGDEIAAIGRAIEALRRNALEREEQLREKAETAERLALELAEAQEQQTATSEVLRVISNSPGALEPVFAAMLSNAVRICGANFGNLFLCEGDAFRHVAMHGAPPAFAELRRRNPLVRPTPNSVLTRISATRRAQQVAAIREGQSYLDGDPATRELANAAGARTLLGVPMLKDGRLVGAIGIYRQELRPFTEKQVALVESFAAQAMIAIENTRLFEAERARTKELAESLEHQVATGAILRAIAASPTDIHPVLRVVVETASRLCDAYDVALMLREGDSLRLGAHHGPIPIDFEQQPIGRGWVTGRAVVDAAPVHVSDLAAAGDEFPVGQEFARRLGHRTTLGIPLLRRGRAIGAIVLRRVEVRPFSPKQIALLETFADQAVIAIENTRLFEEVQAHQRDLEARSAELAESLQYQTATGEVLSVISRSPNELQPVLDAITQTAARLCQADYAHFRLLSDGAYHVMSATNYDPETLKRLTPIMPGPGSIAGRAA